ncbi:MAG: hypothetical protein ABSB22_22825 [Thermodesulfobacteriota bacterium]
MREIFRRKSLWFILVILLFAACVYPPFLLMTEGGITTRRKWRQIDINIAFSRQASVHPRLLEAVLL